MRAFTQPDIDDSNPDLDGALAALQAANEHDIDDVNDKLSRACSFRIEVDEDKQDGASVGDDDATILQDIVGNEEIMSLLTQLVR